MNSEKGLNLKRKVWPFAKLETTLIRIIVSDKVWFQWWMWYETIQRSNRKNVLNSDVSNSFSIVN